MKRKKSFCANVLSICLYWKFKSFFFIHSSSTQSNQKKKKKKKKKRKQKLFQFTLIELKFAIKEFSIWLILFKCFIWIKTQDIVKENLLIMQSWDKQQKTIKATSSSRGKCWLKLFKMNERRWENFPFRLLLNWVSQVTEWNVYGKSSN